MNAMHNNFVTAVKPIATYFSFLGIVPWYSFKKYRIVHSKIFKFYSVFLAVVATAMSFSLLFVRAKYILWFAPIVIAVQDVLLEASGLSLFLVTVFGSSFWNMTSWERLFMMIHEIENQLAIYSIIRKKRYGMKSFYFLFGLGNIYLLVLFAIDYGHVDNNYCIRLYYTSTQIFRYIAYIIAYVIFSTAVIIKYTYEDINSLCHSERNVRAKTLEGIKKAYLKMIEVTQTFTKLFGWPILLLYFYSVAQMITCLSLLSKKPMDPHGTSPEYNLTFYLHLTYLFEILVSKYIYLMY